MKAGKRSITAILLGGIAMFASFGARADTDLDVCQAGYKVLLMTQGECRSYLRELRAAQDKADHAAVLDLQEWHATLLIERSQACPCQLKPVAMRAVGSGNLSRQVASLTKD